MQQLPRFQQTQLSNYTMRVGKTVQFSCTVGNLGPLYKVIPWTSSNAQMYFIVWTLSAHFSGCVAALGKGYVSCASICDHSERPRERLARQSGDVQSSNRRHPGRHSSAFTFRTSSSGGNHALQIEMETTLHRARFEWIYMNALNEPHIRRRATRASTSVKSTLARLCPSAVLSTSLVSYRQKF